MTKWDYIRLISKRGTAYGTNGGVLDLLQWSGKPNTGAVTEEEARTFWEYYDRRPEAELPTTEESAPPLDTSV